MPGVHGLAFSAHHGRAHSVANARGCCTTVLLCRARGAEGGDRPGSPALAIREDLGVRVDYWHCQIHPQQHVEGVELGEYSAGLKVNPP